jgi:hypothetical protein
MWIWPLRPSLPPLYAALFDWPNIINAPAGPEGNIRAHWQSINIGVLKDAVLREIGKSRAQRISITAYLPFPQHGLSGAQREVMNYIGAADMSIDLQVQTGVDIDARLKEGLKRVFKQSEPNEGTRPRKFVVGLVSGDGDYIELLRALSKDRPCTIHVWSWKSNLHRDYHRLAGVHYLDDVKYLLRPGYERKNGVMSFRPRTLERVL